MSDAPSRHSQRRELRIHGARPPPLRLISKQSRKIRKQTIAAPPEAKSHSHPPPPPLIIYTVTPKVIHVDPSEFMSLVQRLTGSNSTTSSSSTLNMTPPPPPSSATASGSGVAEVPKWRETQYFDGGDDEMPQNLVLNETDSNNPLNSGLHGNRNLSNYMITPQMMSMSSSPFSDVFNYLFDI